MIAWDLYPYRLQDWAGFSYSNGNFFSGFFRKERSRNRPYFHKLPWTPCLQLCGKRLPEYSQHPANAEKRSQRCFLFQNSPFQKITEPFPGTIIPKLSLDGDPNCFCIALDEFCTLPQLCSGNTLTSDFFNHYHRIWLSGKWQTFWKNLIWKLKFSEYARFQAGNFSFSLQWGGSPFLGPLAVVANDCSHQLETTSSIRLPFPPRNKEQLAQLFFFAIVLNGLPAGCQIPAGLSFFQIRLLVVPQSSDPDPKHGFTAYSV